MIEQRNRFIRDVDFNEATSLTHLLDRHDREEDVDVEIPISSILLFMVNQNLLIS